MLTPWSSLIIFGQVGHVNTLTIFGQVGHVITLTIFGQVDHVNSLTIFDQVGHVITHLDYICWSRSCYHRGHIWANTLTIFVQVGHVITLTIFGQVGHVNTLTIFEQTIWPYSAYVVKFKVILIHFIIIYLRSIQYIMKCCHKHEAQFWCCNCPWYQVTEVIFYDHNLHTKYGVISDLMLSPLVHQGLATGTCCKQDKKQSHFYVCRLIKQVVSSRSISRRKLVLRSTW